MPAAALPITTAVDGEYDNTLTLSTLFAPDGTVTVAAVGDVDAATAPPLRTVLEDQLERRPPRLMLDLSGVRFLGSAGLALLVETHQATCDRGIVLRLIAAQRAVIRPLEVTGLIDLFTFADGGDQEPTPGS